MWPAAGGYTSWADVGLQLTALEVLDEFESFGPDLGGAGGRRLDRSASSGRGGTCLPDVKAPSVMIIRHAPTGRPVLPGVMNLFAIGSTGFGVAAVDDIELPVGVVGDQVGVGVADRQDVMPTA